MGLVLAGLLLGLALAEAWLRSPWGPAKGYENLLAEAPRLYDLSIFADDRELGMVLKPGSQARFRTPEFSADVRVNRLGLRGPELGPKPDGALRVLAVGDSFTLGLQVSEAQHFGEALSIGLTENLGRPVEVLNGGVDGFGTQAATRYAARVIDAAEVDAVLLSFFLGNDFWDNMAFGRPHHEGERLQNAPGWSAFLQRRFALAYYLRVVSQAHLLDPDTPRGRRHRQEAEVFVDPKALERAMVSTRPALDAFAGLCRAKGLRCAMAIIPPMFTIDAARAQSTFSALGLAVDPEHMDMPAQALLKASPVPALDLGPPLRAASQEEPQYLTFDGHWTAAGHATVAEALTPWLSGLWGAPADP